MPENDFPEGRRRYFLFATAIALSASLPGVAWSQDIAPEADRVLHAMSDHLAGLLAFQLTAEASTEILMRDGRKIQLTADSEALVDREHGAHIERHGPGGTTVVVYDGETLSIGNADVGVHGSLPAPGGLDVALDEVRMVLGDEAVGGSDLLYSNPYEGLMLEVESGEYLGTARVGGLLTHHLSYRATDIDWQLWVAAEGDPLPVRYVITSKWMTAAPQFTVQIRSFEEVEAGATEGFSFSAPEGSREVTSAELATHDLLIEE